MTTVNQKVARHHRRIAGHRRRARAGLSQAGLGRRRNSRSIGASDDALVVTVAATSPIRPWPAT